MEAWTFQSTPPRGGATRLFPRTLQTTSDFNPRPPREGGDNGLIVGSLHFILFQSTPPAKGATHHSRTHGVHRGISIHAPREGGDLLTCFHSPVRSDFNPRPPRGGRLGRSENSSSAVNFNPRPPRGGRRPCRTTGR